MNMNEWPWRIPLGNKPWTQHNPLRPPFPNPDPSPWIPPPPKPATPTPSKLEFGSKKRDYKKNYTLLILDSSSSMMGIQGEIVSAFNAQIKEIKKSPIETKVSLVTFSTLPHEPKFWNRDAERLEELGAMDYRPDGLTALNDTIGTALNQLLKEEDTHKDDTSILVLILTDGYENNSKKYDNRRVSAMLEELQGTGRCTVTYLGANQDRQQVADMYHIPLSNVANFAATKGGVRGTSQVMGASLNAYYSSGGQSTDNFTGGVTDIPEDDTQ